MDDRVIGKRGQAVNSGGKKKKKGGRGGFPFFHADHTLMGGAELEILPVQQRETVEGQQTLLMLSVLEDTDMQR